MFFIDITNIFAYILGLVRKMSLFFHILQETHAHTKRQTKQANIMGVGFAINWYLVLLNRTSTGVMCLEPHHYGGSFRLN